MDEGAPGWILGVLAVVLFALGGWLFMREPVLSPPAAPRAAAAIPRPELAPGFAPRRTGLAMDLQGAHPIRAVGDPFGSVAGQVMNWSTGVPIVGAEVTFIGAAGVSSVVTDGQGGFVFRATSAGVLWVGMVTAEGFLPFAPEVGLSPLRFVPRPGRRVDDVRIHLRPALEYRGLVLTDGGDPVAGAAVYLLGAESGERALAGLPDRFTSGGDGSFVFSAPDGAWLEAFHPEHGVGRGRMIGPALTRHEIELRLRSDNPATTGVIVGKVLDPEGEALAGVQVAAAGDAERPWSLSVTEGDGAFRLESLVPGTYALEARHRSFAPAHEVGVETGRSEVTIQLTTGGAIAGHVTTTDHEPVASASVVALRHTSELLRRPERQVTVFDAEGAYRIEGLPSGRYTVIGATAGRASARVEGLIVATDTVSADLQLPAGATVRGRVTDEETGAALPLARVTVERSGHGGPSVVPMITSAVTDSRGHYEISGVEAGRHSVQALAHGHDTRTLSGLEIEDGAEVTHVDLGLAPTDPDSGGTRFDIVGIGAALATDGEMLKIQDVLPDSGAQRAELAVGDVIVAVDGAPILELGFEGAIQAIRGVEGTMVNLTMVRGEADAVEVRVRRSRIRG